MRRSFCNKIVTHRTAERHEYKPFADVSGGLGRLRDFLNVALQDRGQHLEAVGEHLFKLRDTNSVPLVRFTDDRDKATLVEGLELLGLDHPVVEEALGRARPSAPEELGIAVQSEDGIKGVASFWLVEAATQKGERRSFVLPWNYAKTALGCRKQSATVIVISPV
jgi:hypothetical protein